MAIKIHNHYRIAFIIIALTLTGCANMRVQKPKAPQYKVIPSKVRQQKLAQIKFWRINGPFSITQGKRSKIANYTWQQMGRKTYRIRITSALGLSSVLIIGYPHSVTLWRNDRHFVSAKSSRQLIKKELGYALPIANLNYWARGLPAPGRHYTSFDQFGHLKTLQQQGWRLTYADYKTINGVDLPGKIMMTRPGLSIDIVIRKWHWLTPTRRITPVDMKTISSHEVY